MRAIATSLMGQQLTWVLKQSVCLIIQFDEPELGPWFFGTLASEVSGSRLTALSSSNSAHFFLASSADCMTRGLA
jgi:hypothetical protein